MIAIVLIVLALICFIAAAVNAKFGSVNLVALGLAFWVATVLLGLLH
jgi:hypothetical protein